MPQRMRRKSRGKCLVWRGISACKPSAEVAREKGFRRQDGGRRKSVYSDGYVALTRLECSR